MSRSNPSENSNPNPATRWFEWNGEKGEVRYYDKATKEQVGVGTDFTFLLLDQLGSVRGWHDESQSAIYSNEVKDTRQEVLIVKAFKAKAPLAEGIYKDIKDRIAKEGAQFVTNCYIAYKNGNGLSIGSFRLKGAALGAWMEFSKEHRADLFTKAIRINGAKPGKKGRVTFFTPIFEVKDMSPQTNSDAVELDKELQKFFASYFKRTKRDQVEVPQDEPEQQEPPSEPVPPLTDDDIPFAWLLPLVLPMTGLLSWMA